LVPKGFDAHPQAHYPLMVFHGHFPEDASEFRETPPDPNLKPVYSERFHLAGYNRIEQEEAYKSYQKWISADFPRFLVVEIQHANPYFDDSYAVNSANLGPYGDAINKELIPEIERRFRGIGGCALDPLDTASDQPIEAHRLRVFRSVPVGRGRIAGWAARGHALGPLRRTGEPLSKAARRN